MYLRNVESGPRLHHRLLMSAMRLGAGKVPDVVRTVLYRGEFFGRPYAALMQAVMRGPSEWSVGNRELFAAFVSRQNQCSF
jgi:hypothetical protein